jgi:hypothetical protein
MQGVKKMKISTIDLFIIFLSFSYGTYALFIDNNDRFSNEIAGILSFIVSIWISISCVGSLKRKN